MVEGTVGVVSNFILAALRNRRFLSLAELNEAIAERLYEFNHKPFQKKDGSRALSFEEEKSFLLPLPPRPFELATWKIATVAPSYAPPKVSNFWGAYHIHQYGSCCTT